MPSAYAVTERLKSVSPISLRAWFPWGAVEAAVGAGLRAAEEGAQREEEAKRVQATQSSSPAPRSQIPQSPYAGIYFHVGTDTVYLQFSGNYDKMAPLKAVDPERSTWGFYHSKNGDWWAKTKLPDRLLNALARYVTDDQLKLLELLASKIDRTEKPEGNYKLLGSGYVKLYLDRPWKPYGPIKSIVATRVENEKGKARVFYHMFKASRAANLVAPALAQAGFKTVARELVEKFAGVAEPYDAKAAACDPLRDMADAPDPGDVKHPIGKAAVADVLAALRVGTPAKLALKGYQVVGVSFMKLIGYRGIIGDDMGLGKTVQGLGGILVEGQALLPCVVVAPSSVFINWRTESNMWLPSINVYMMDARNSPPPPRGFNGIIVTTFSLVAYQLDAIMSVGPRYMIVDEAHRIKNGDTQQAQAVNELAMAIPHVVLLTGTPIENNITELWNLLQTVDTEDYAQKNTFVDEYAVTEQVGKFKKIVGVKNADNLKHRLQCLMIRRLKGQVAKDLPELSRQYLSVEGTPAQMKEYRKAEHEFADWLKAELTKRLTAELEAEGYDPESVDVKSEIFNEVRKRAERAVGGGSEALTRANYLRQLVGRMKVAPSVEFIADIVANGEPVITFGVHQDVVWGLAEGLQAAGVRVGVIDGSTDKEDRGRLVEDFQKGKIDVIIGSEAMREGVTLTRSHIVMIVEHMWTPAREEQAEGRAHRTGQRNSVQAIYPEVHGTFDDRMHVVLEHKRKIVKDVIGSADVDTETGALTEVLAGFLDGATPGTKKGKKKIAQPEARANPRQHELRRSEVVAVVFDQAQWRQREAAAWLKANGLGGGAGGGSPRFERIQDRIVARLKTGRGKSRGESYTIAGGVTIVV